MNFICIRRNSFSFSAKSGFRGVDSSRRAIPNAGLWIQHSPTLTFVFKLIVCATAAAKTECRREPAATPSTSAGVHAKPFAAGHHSPQILRNRGRHKHECRGGNTYTYYVPLETRKYFDFQNNRVPCLLAKKLVLQRNSRSRITRAAQDFAETGDFGLTLQEHLKLTR